jgi:acyl transferase domain-containing protein
MSGAVSGAVNVPPAVLAQDARALPFTSLSATPKGLESSRIAVIGLACDFPGAPDADTFWRNLEQGVDAVTEVPADRWDIGQIYSPSGGVGRSISKWGGFIKDAKLFDPEYFGIQASDAAGLDPLVRKALEVCVQGLRDAGMQDAELKGSRTGVYLGARMGDYGARLVNRDKSGITGSAQNFIAAQIAHCLDLHGPNLVVDTACSSSLMAVHLAARSLLDGESDLALAGGVDLLLDETPYIGLSAGQALSPRGRCATFDEQADGLVPGEGAGVVVLKRLDRALADGDRILAVLEGSAVNNDGRTMGLTTPNPQAQQAVISEALARAAVSAQTVSYVEAHGTGTMIGDPIELRSLWRALGDEGARGRCGVGSVKSNIGHLLSAAGVASLIKVVLMVSERKLVPTLHCDRPNPRFAFETSPLMPVRALQSWSGVDGVCRAGVSAFGFGGTNVHAVVSNEGIPANYQPTKQALPAQVFNRREFWLEKIRSTYSMSHPETSVTPVKEVKDVARRVLALEEIDLVGE